MSNPTSAPGAAAAPEPPCVPTVDPASPLRFVINVASGRQAPEATRQLIEQALRTAGRSGELLFPAEGALETVARRAAASAAAERGAVIAVGGDGTINAVAQAAHTEGASLGVVPMGTFNYFARAHGLPSDAAEAVSALCGWAPVPVQVGQINTRIFLVNASLGLYPELLQDREAYKARFGRSRLVAFGAGLSTLLGTRRRLRIRIERGAGVRDVVTSTLFVGNNRLQLERLGVQAAPALDQGQLAALMLRPIGTLPMFGLLLRGAMGTLGEADDVESFGFQRMVVRPGRLPGRRKVTVAYDGEVGRMTAPLDFRVSPRPLYLLRPAPAGDPESGLA